jgi:hypothetical protein
MKYYDDYHGRHHRAVQAWQILVTVAKIRQTMSYEDLSKAMNLNGTPFMSDPLYRIDRVCARYDLPKLNDLVVNKDNKPGYKKHNPARRSWLRDVGSLSSTGTR